MTNYEYYRKQIEKITRLGLGFGIYKTTGEVDFCSRITCTGCKFFGGCNVKKINWADEEYKEPSIIDWSRVPIDAKVLVSNEGEYWYNRYFAGCQDENGRILVWADGATSWSVGHPHKKVAFTYAKLDAHDFVELIESNKY